MKTVARFDDFSWPLSRSGELLESLVREAKLDRKVGKSLSNFVPVTSDRAGVGRWADTALANLGLESEPLHASYGQVGDVVRTAGPALLYIEDDAEPRLLGLLRSRGKDALVIATDHSVVKVPRTVLEEALLRRVFEKGGPAVDAVLDEAKVKGARRESARRFLILQPVSTRLFEAGWLVRLPPSASFVEQIKNACLTRPLVAMVGANLLMQPLTILAWWMIGRGAMDGHLERGWLVAWALVLFTIVPFRILSAWWQGVIVVGVGALLKRRMLLGALRLDPSEIRHQGTGQALGCVIESESAESLALGGGFASAMAVVDIVVALPVLLAGPGGAMSGGLFLLWIALTAWVSWRLFGRALVWTRGRIRLTDDLFERMVGHRTRLAQEPPALWHTGEDRALADYVDDGARMDETNTFVNAVLGRGFLVLGMLALAPSFLSGQTGAGALAVGVGGVLLARSALARLSMGISSLSFALIAWRTAGPLFNAAARPQITPAPTSDVLRQNEPARGDTLVDAHDLVFRYRKEGAPVLSRASLRIHAGDRVLVLGPSGGGKSTFASLLTGLQSPESGLLLLSGFDRHTIGTDGWRRHVVSAPQFHENHILANTFAFNLLMGRAWPPSWDDLNLATTVCGELGLGPLLERMPGGMMQMVGETGWQLSHGEQSRLFIARALLQRAELVVLDESFAALDPETLALSLRCVFERANTLLVIAHP